MAYYDLREWIDALESEGELSKITAEVDWDLEIGGIAQHVFDKGGPALQFENIKGYSDTVCTKLFTASVSTYPRMAMMLGLPKNTHPREMIEVFRERMKTPIKPKILKTGPCKENILKGDDIDVMQFPTPLWHKRDGGRYMGTFEGTITKDPDTGWTNVGLYRRMVLDKNHTGIAIPIGQHIWRHFRKFRKGHKPLPMAVAIGWDPVLPAIAACPIPPEVDEYDVMGGIRQAPVELVKCETSDLMVPATAEIILEGEVSTNIDDFREEGPFGEYTGFYTSEAFKRPVFKINCITHRNDPILQGTLEGVPINEDHRMTSIANSAVLWTKLEKVVPGITAVNADPCTAWTNVYVQVDNSFYGQVPQIAGAIWSQETYFKNVFVCDTDVDIFDMSKVMWAIAYRVRPDKDILTFPGPIQMLDPVIHPSERIHPAVNKGLKMLIDATKPYEWPRAKEWFGEKYPPLAYPDDETMELVKNRWGEYKIDLDG